METELKLYKKEFSRVGLWMVLGAGWIEILQSVTLYIVGKINAGIMDNPNLSLIIRMLPMYLVGMPLLILAMSKLPKVEPEKRKIHFGYIIAAIPMAYAAMQMGNFIGLAIGGIIGKIIGASMDNVVVEIITGVNPFLRLFIMVICAPIYEEIIFRRLVVTRTLKYGEGVAILLSGLMFGLFHGNLNQFTYAFAIGCFFAFIYVKTGNLKITIGLHMFLNFIGGIFGGWLIDLLDYNELMKIMELSKTDIDEYMNAMMAYTESHILGLAVAMVFGLFVIAMVLTGLILFIVFRKKFTLRKGQVELPKGKRFSTMFLNVGMGLYVLYWLVMIALFSF